MDEATIYLTLLGFCGREQHALTDYIAMRMLDDDRPVTQDSVEIARKQNARIREFLDRKMIEAQRPK